MPVLMTAHPRDLDIVRAIAEGLAEGGGEIRCYLEDDDHLLRNIGCKIAVGRLDDAETLAAALTNVHTFLALAPDPLSFDEDEAESLGATLGAWAEAARDAEVAQNTMVLGAALPADDPIAGMMASAPSRFAGVSPLCVIECGLLVGDERPLSVPGEAQARVVPLGDLVRVIQQVDDRESSHGFVRLAGQPMGVEAPPACSPERFAGYVAASLSLEPGSDVLAPLGEGAAASKLPFKSSQA